MKLRNPRTMLATAVSLALAACHHGDDNVSAPASAVGETDSPVCTTPAPAKLPPADPSLAAVKRQFFKITVTDSAAGVPIPGVEVKTTSGDTYQSDDNGHIAFHEPGVMNRDVWFSATRDGYGMTADGLGSVGTRLRVVEGGSGVIQMNKTGTPSTVRVGDLQTRLLGRPVPGRDECMALHIVDRDTQRGVPLVQVTTPNGSYLSDSQGVVAYCDPDHLGLTALQLSSHGYAPRSTSVALSAGGSATLELQRNNVAERLYRLTGQGTYRDSLLLGLRIPVRNGALNAGVTGQDSVISTVFKNKVFWTWGDTNSAGYALGNFNTSAGTSSLPGQGGLSADVGVDLDYMLNTSGDFVKGVIPDILPQLSSPVWMGALVTVSDAAGNDTLFGTYSKAINDGESAERGLARYDEASKTFKSVLTYPLDAQGVPGGGQVMRLRSGGQEWAHYPGHLRIAARASAMTDRAAYQVYSGWRDAAGTQLDVVNGAVQYRWRNGTSGKPVTQDDAKAAGLAVGQSIDGHLRDVETGNRIESSVDSVHWNAHRGRFVRILQQKFGTSFAGEIWYAEADTPMGPWVDARKVVTHDNYTFYNPYTHPYLSTDDGRTVYFEATYTATYSTAKPTPRYNYNQIMYRVDTDDPRLALPVPIYDLGGAVPGLFVRRAGVVTEAPRAASFLAPDHAAAGTVPVGWDAASGAPNRRLVSGASVVETIFHAMPASAAARPPTAVALYEYTHADGRRAYSVDPAWSGGGFVRAVSPLAYVWRNPVQVPMPVADYREMPSSTLSTCRRAGAA